MKPAHELHVFASLDELARAAADLTIALAKTAVEARGRFSLALSGGSTPRSLYGLLASPEFAGQMDWARAHLFWGDERCVPPGHPDSNYGMVQQALLDHIPIPPENVHRIEAEAGGERAAQAYEGRLRAFFGGRPRFDLILLGLGDDGHTASIFPGTAAVHETARWVAAVEHTAPPPPLVDRVTLTPAAINSARQVVFLVAGAGKAERLRDVLRGPHQPDRLPAQAVQPAGGKLAWLVDQAAARIVQQA